MGLNNTPSAERVHIGFFGCRNAGKSSLVNAVTNQKISVVSNVRGTTTDPVKKTMELLPLGPVVIIDTPGYDDCGYLGEMRVRATKDILRSCDIAVLVTDGTRDINEDEKELISIFSDKKIPFVIAKNKCDLMDEVPNDSKGTVYVSAEKKTGIENLKNALANINSQIDSSKKLLGDLIEENDTVVLVTPIDSAAPKGRMIMPQQMAIRDIIDAGAICVVTRETELEKALDNLTSPPILVVTDSQAFEKVSKIVPTSIPLTSFSILMARYKGFLKTALQGANVLDTLKDGDKVLISEGCTHHRQCDDIGTVKMPKWIKNHTKKDIDFEFTSGGTFPDDLTTYALIVHCGGCMVNEREMKSRMERAVEQNVPFTNYGTAIAHMNGILKRTIAPVKDTIDL